jgi:hypothetical protein
MNIHLPIAEVSVNILLLLGIGGGVGLLSGLFGVGGGFLLTPLLIFIGIPSAVAVATDAMEVLGASVSGFLAHWRRGNVDFRMGTILLIGGAAGSTLGAFLFKFLREIGQIDLFISLSYVALLSSVGGLMALESVRTMLRQRRPGSAAIRLRRHTWAHRLPLKVRFRKSRLYISALLPLGVGFFVGVMSALMGVGGGFIMVPAMIYLLGMPTSVVVGTSLFQIIFVTANVTFLHSVNTQTVDVVLAVILLLGAAVGAQIGTRIGVRLQGAQLRALLALLVLLVAGKLACDLTITPENPFSVRLG